MRFGSQESLYAHASTQSESSEFFLVDQAGKFQIIRIALIEVHF